MSIYFPGSKSFTLIEREKNPSASFEPKCLPYNWICETPGGKLRAVQMVTVELKMAFLKKKKKKELIVSSLPV